MENEEINPQSLERIGQYLDGQKVVLSPEERLLAAEVDSDQRALAGMLDDVQVPPGMMDRIRRQTRVQVVAPVWRLFKVVSWSAAAAAVLVACLFIWQGTRHTVLPIDNGSGIAAENPLEKVAGEVAPTESDKIDLISCMTMDSEDLKLAIEQTSPDKIFGGE